MAPEFEIIGDHIVKSTYVEPGTFRIETVMDKETFIEAYNRWIKGEVNHVDKS